VAASRPARVIDLGDARERLVRHRIYGLVDSGDRLRRFMESHVFAVWDFQSLLKAMQQRLTCTALPWVPSMDPEARRLVNEIVLDEESDALPEGGSASHFELYLDGMRKAGADTGPVERMIGLLREAHGVGGRNAGREAAPEPGSAGNPGQAPHDQGLLAMMTRVLGEAGAPPAAAAFVRESFAVIESGSTHGIVAAFTYGREDVIPDMFRGLVASLADRDPAWSRFRYYLDRHIEADDEKHAPVCRRIMARLCGDDSAKWAEASSVARGCMEARIALWDAIAADLEAMPSH
jgi:hypothetical protein